MEIKIDSNNTYSKLAKNVIVNTAIVLPIVFTFYYVYNYGVTIPFWDQWEFVPLLEKMHNHTLSLADLWAQHNEHRIIFPQIVMLILARLSNWNIFWELCTNIVLAIFILLFLLSILHNTIKSTSPFLKIFISMMVFSMVQRENWEWGWQIQMFMSVLGSVIAIWAANKWQGKAIGLIVIIPAAILSSYSFNSGLLTWLAVLVVFLLQKKWKLKHIIILVSACIATVLLYYYKYTKPINHPPVLSFVSHPLIYAEYITTYLGGALVWHFPPGRLAVTIISLFLISLAIFNLRRFDKQTLQEQAPWLGLALYACMAACATALGRAGFGWQQAVSSRYTTISLFLPLCAIVLLRYSIRFNPKKEKEPLKSIIFIIIILTFIVSYIISYRDNVRDMKKLSAYTNASAFCLTNPKLVNDDFMKGLYSDPNIVKTGIKTLSELGIKFKIKSEMPDDPNLLNSLGYALAHIGEYNKAIPLYNKALQIDPDFINARINLGIALANSGNLPQAILEYEKILLAYPDNYAAHNNLGIMLTMQGKIDDAIAHFRHAVKINPQGTDAKKNLNAALTKKQKSNDSVTEGTGN
jgi:tetratricopeptide (TPR) repeat protein